MGNQPFPQYITMAAQSHSGFFANLAESVAIYYVYQNQYGSVVHKCCIFQWLDVSTISFGCDTVGPASILDGRTRQSQGSQNGNAAQSEARMRLSLSLKNPKYFRCEKYEE